MSIANGYGSTEELRQQLTAAQAEARELREKLGQVWEAGRRMHAMLYALGEPIDEEWRRVVAALSQPAEQPAAQEALPLMARETAARMIGPTLAECVTKATEGGIQYLIADTDEHGLPVIQRTADMPEGAKYRLEFAGTVRYTKNKPHLAAAERIEDYRHGQEGRELRDQIDADALAHEEARNTIEMLQAELARAQALLNAARCPNCDGSGATPHEPTPDGDWEWQQCQWCDERAALSQSAEQAPLMIRCQVCEHHTPVVFEPEPAQREGL